MGVDVGERRLCRGGIGLQSHREVEGAALAGFALQPHVATHQFDQAARYGQPEAGAAKAAGGRGVFLREGVENQLLLVRGDADAGVAHRQVDYQVLAILCVQFGVQRDLAALGELDRVADEVDQHLADAAGITDQLLRQVGLDLEGQFKILFEGAQRERLQRFGDGPLEVERNLFDEQLAGLDLGEVENVVDHGQQRIGRGFDDT